MLRSPALALLLLTATPLYAASPAGVDAAAARLSVYARGQVPSTAATLDDIDALAQAGGPAELGLLRELAQHEAGDVRRRASDSLAAVERRVFDQHRATYRASLPSAGAVRARATRWTARGLASTSASCAAYADLIIGPPTGSLQAVDEPEHAALAAARLLGRGEVAAAVQAWARAAALGSDSAFAALPAYGIDPERLLLGMLAAGWAPAEPTLAVLARRGENLTVELLAERVSGAGGSSADQALDALAGMVLARERARPLSPADASLARKALQRAASEPDLPLSPAVRRALLTDD